MTQSERIYVLAEIGMASLVAIAGADEPSRYPLSFGNYFSLSSDHNPMYELRVANFWAENMKETRKRFLEDGMVSVIRWRWGNVIPAHPCENCHQKGGYHDWCENGVVPERHQYEVCIIDDARIPDDWYNNKMCWTGSTRPPLEIAQQMYAVRGDATNELEQWSDPMSYYAKRGGVYKNGVVRYEIPARSQPLKDNGLTADIEIKAS